MGVGSASFFHHAGQERKLGETPITDPLRLAAYCAELGEGGIQARLPTSNYSYASKLRSLTEKNGMYFEATAELPRNEADLDDFKKTIKATDQASASVVRVVLFTGSR